MISNKTATYLSPNILEYPLHWISDDALTCKIHFNIFKLIVFVNIGVGYCYSGSGTEFYATVLSSKIIIPIGAREV